MKIVLDTGGKRNTGEGTMVLASSYEDIIERLEDNSSASPSDIRLFVVPSRDGVWLEELYKLLGDVRTHDIQIYWVGGLAHKQANTLVLSRFARESDINEVAAAEAQREG